MITIKDASQIAVVEIDRILDLIRIKFETIEFDKIKSQESFHITCNLKETNKEIIDITISFLPDFERQNPKIPKNIKEYYSAGGGEKLMEKLSDSNENAWKCQIKSNLKNGKILEYGISLNEKNFSNKLILELFDRYLLDK